MSTRTVAAFGVVTAVLLAIAYFVAASRTASFAPTEPGLLFPGLAPKLNEVRAVIVEHAGERTTLESRDSGWVVQNKDGYPARFEMVKGLLVAFSELRSLEPRTSDPQRYARIGVQDPGSGSGSVRITFLDTGGDELAGVILGDAAPGGVARRYARVAGRQESWLAEGRVDALTDPMDWIDREIVRLPADSVAAVRLQRPDRGTVMVSRAPDGGVRVDGLPDDRAARDERDLLLVFGALGHLTMSDVASHPKGNGAPADAATTRYTTRDGLSVTVQSWTESGAGWAVLSAEAPPPSEDSEEPPGAAGARSDAALLNNRWRGWCFGLDAAGFNAVRPDWDDFSVVSGPEGAPASGG